MSALADAGCFMKRRLDQHAGMTAFNFSEQLADVQNTATMQASTLRILRRGMQALQKVSMPLPLFLLN